MGSMGKNNVPIFRPGKVVVLLSGRHAGKKGIVVKDWTGGTDLRRYGHALVVCLAKLPRKVTRRQRQYARKKKSTLKICCKLINHNHLMPTRYTFEVDEIFKLLKPESS